MRSSYPLNLPPQCTVKLSQPNGFSNLSWADSQKWIDVFVLKDMKNTRNFSGQMSNKKEGRKGGKKEGRKADKQALLLTELLRKNLNDASQCSKSDS